MSYDKPPRVPEAPTAEPRKEAGATGGDHVGASGPLVHHPGVIQERSGLTVVLLSFVTCGIYYLYWMYTTDRELGEALDDPDIKPGQDLLLTFVTCGIWSIYVEYRNAQKVYSALRAHDPQATDNSQMILICNVAALFVGATWLLATYVLQEQLNKLARY